MSSIQRPTMSLSVCVNGQAHDFHVSTWSEFDLPQSNDDPEPVRGRVASAFYCSHCLVQVEAAVLYAERTTEDAETHPVGEIDARLALAVLHDLANEAEQVEVGEFGSLAAEQAEQRRAALEWAIAQIRSAPVAPSP